MGNLEGNWNYCYFIYATELLLLYLYCHYYDYYCYDFILEVIEHSYRFPIQSYLVHTSTESENPPILFMRKH